MLRKSKKVSTAPPKPKAPAKVKAKKVKAKTLLNKADELAGAACRARGHCEAAGWQKTRPKACGGYLSWCHIIGRSHKTIRHSPLNCACLCVSCHQWFTDHPQDWVRFVEDKWPGRWESLNQILQEKAKPDYRYWLDYYRRQLEGST